MDDLSIHKANKHRKQDANNWNWDNFPFETYLIPFRYATLLPHPIVSIKPTNLHGGIREIT